MTKHPIKKHRTDWHEATVCALQIELEAYSHLLDFHSEYILGKNAFRIDLLIIKKLLDEPIPKNLARIFRTYNIFEIKGLGSSVTTDAYYKTNGYAGHLISSTGKLNQFSRFDVSLSFLSNHYPQKLFRHLVNNCHLTIEKSAPGIYYILNEMYATQVLVTKELSPDENLYLKCLTNKLSNQGLINRLADNYSMKQGHDIYERYMNQLINANLNPKGESPMCCEGIFKLYGTSSKEIAEKAAAQATKAAMQKAQDIYVPQIHQLQNENNTLASKNQYLEQLLIQHGIVF